MFWWWTVEKNTTCAPDRSVLSGERQIHSQITTVKSCARWHGAQGKTSLVLPKEMLWDKQRERNGGRTRCTWGAQRNATWLGLQAGGRGDWITKKFVLDTKKLSLGTFPEWLTGSSQIRTALSLFHVCLLCLIQSYNIPRARRKAHYVSSSSLPQWVSRALKFNKHLQADFFKNHILIWGKTWFQPKSSDTYSNNEWAHSILLKLATHRRTKPALGHLHALIFSSCLSHC